MKITLKNIGIIKNHEIEIGNFTVVCGKNNTGKTYLSYTVYGLLKHLETHKGNETFSVPEFCENIHRVFNINQDEFKETTIEINNTNNIDTIVDFQFDDIKIQRIENDFVKLTISQKKINELNENDEDILGSDLKEK